MVNLLPSKAVREESGWVLSQRALQPHCNLPICQICLYATILNPTPDSHSALALASRGRWSWITGSILSIPKS